MTEAIERLRQQVQDNAADLVQDGFASVTEAMRYLSISRTTLYALMDGSQLAYAKVGRSRRIPWRALHAFAAAALVGRGQGNA